MPATIHNFTLYPGITWEGRQIIVVDAAGDPVAQGAGTTYLLQARTATGKDLAFALPVTRGTEADGQVLIPEVAAATTATLPIGSFGYDIIPIGADSKPWEPIVKGVITVAKTFSVPS